MSETWTRGSNLYFLIKLIASSPITSWSFFVTNNNKTFNGNDKRFIHSISGLSRDPRQTSLTRRIRSSGGGRRHSQGDSAPPVPPPSRSWPTEGSCVAPASWACVGTAPPGCRVPRPGAASAAPNSGQFCSINCSEVVTVCSCLSTLQSVTSHSFLWVLNSWM